MRTFSQRLSYWPHPDGCRFSTIGDILMTTVLSTWNLLHMIDRKKGTGTHIVMQVGETSPITRPITVHTDASLCHKNGRCLAWEVTELPSQPSYSILECWTSWSCAMTWSHGIAPCSTPSVASSHQRSDLVSDAGPNIHPVTRCAKD